MVDENKLGVELDQRQVQVDHAHEGVLLEHLSEALVRLAFEQKKKRNGKMK